MKRALFFITAVIFSALSLNAQEGGDFELGSNVGLNLSNVSSGDNQINTNSRVGFNFGVSGEYYFSDSWGIKMKLIYDGKGWADAFIFNNIDGSQIVDETNFRLNYLTVPVMASWHFGRSRNWYTNIGPYVGFLVSATDSELDLDIKDAFKSTDVGVALGIGHKFDISNNTQLYVEYDGQISFADVFEENASDSVRNGRSSFNIGLLFDL